MIWTSGPRGLPGTGSTPASDSAGVGTIRICGDDGRELPPGEIGTVYFERDELPFAYHNDPVKTAEAQHPQHPAWTTTGDIGYLDDEGFLFLTDRKVFMIISGGVNIYPQEIEDALALHPKVFDVAVIGVPDAEMGESVKSRASGTGNPHRTQRGVRRSCRSRLRYFGQRTGRTSSRTSSWPTPALARCGCGS